MTITVQSFVCFYESKMCALANAKSGYLFSNMYNFAGRHHHHHHHHPETHLFPLFPAQHRRLDVQVHAPVQHTAVSSSTNLAKVNNGRPFCLSCRMSKFKTGSGSRTSLLQIPTGNGQDAKTQQLVSTCMPSPPTPYLDFFPSDSIISLRHLVLRSTSRRRNS